jgi:transposase, IS30 family
MHPGREPSPSVHGHSAKGTDFASVSAAQLDAVADELNDRPRKRLGFYKPSEKITDLLLQ